MNGDNMEEELQTDKQQPNSIMEMSMSDEISSVDTGASNSIDAKQQQQQQHRQLNQRANDESPSPSRINSSNSLTYYYSSFDLFENSNPAFLKYRRFINKLQIYLGPDWVMYANQVLYREDDFSGGRFYHNNTVVFEVCLEIWLQMRREFNRDLKNLGESSNPSHQSQSQSQSHAYNGESNTSTLQEISFSMFEENEIYEQFSAKFASQFPDCQIDQMTYKPVLHGFFLSAIETWNYILRNPTKKRPRSDSFKQVLDDYKQKIIKPIMVVQQKLTGIFGQTPNIKNVEQTGQQQQQQQQQQNLNENLLRSFKNFAKNMNNEEEMMVEEMKKLEINSTEAQPTQQQQQETNPAAQQPPKLKKISEVGDKAIVDFAQSYLQTIVNDTEKRWQVARGFVTNIIELKYNDFQQYANDIKIRFLQPAQDFYNQLMDTYILFKSNNQQNIQFKDFLEKTKLSLGSKWSESLVIPTQVFFSTLINQWNSILNEGVNTNREYDDETIIHMFVQRVRSRMAASWDENIVRKAQENISE